MLPVLAILIQLQDSIKICIEGVPWFIDKVTVEEGIKKVVAREYKVEDIRIGTCDRKDGKILRVIITPTKRALKTVCEVSVRLLKGGEEEIGKGEVGCSSEEIIAFMKAIRIKKSIWIYSKPEGAKLFFRGKLVGMTPIRLSGIEENMITITLRKDGFEEAQINIDLREEGGFETIVLKPLAGVFVKTDTPSIAQVKVFIDGVERQVNIRGEVIASLGEGEHVVSVKTPCGQKREVVMLKPGIVQKVDMMTFGTIYIQTDPPEAEIMIRSKSSKMNLVSPVMRYLCGGKYLVKASKKYFLPQEREILLEGGKQKSIFFELVPEKGAVSKFKAEWKRSRILLWSSIGIVVFGIGVIGASVMRNDIDTRLGGMVGGGIAGAGFVTLTYWSVIKPEIPKDLEKFIR